MLPLIIERTRLRSRLINGLPHPGPVTLTMPHIPISLSPVPGFCIKSLALTHADYPLRHHTHSPALPIPKARKVFVNIAFDQHVPAPPPGTDVAIERAIAALASPADNSPDDYFVPVVVSDPREVLDKAGKPSVVFDAVFNAALKPKSAKSLEFKAFLIELALQRIEAQSSPSTLSSTSQPALLLSRQFGTPNIKAKGELKPRTVLIPEELFTDGQKRVIEDVSGKKLVDELDVSGKGKEGEQIRGKILVEEVSVGGKESERGEDTPQWSWEEKEGRVRVIVMVPRMTHAHISSTTLDVEPHRIELLVPGLYALDISSDLIKLKRELDVDGAQAEWHVAEGTLVLYA
ncbi:hypothetical protein NEOLEDRAFT_1070187 [Neolentinus lepideus HHB14362 ss-1]|uniref:PIH1 N-terminal domain-containing protein n=1 Tax=Neolentinus lepideus HHB14362 ss-1 TaxID=1314782 RepID=A0A165QYF1_9AGAM|nr:hypothetical protein NEOLEDRAFT_1070187 [Neolentinus lepideus HHB14362 ss-1]